MADIKIVPKFIVQLVLVYSHPGMGPGLMAPVA